MIIALYPGTDTRSDPGRQTRCVLWRWHTTITPRSPHDHPKGPSSTNPIRIEQFGCSVD